MNDKVEEMAGLMKAQQRRLDDLQGRVIRLETVLELALHRSSGVRPVAKSEWRPNLRLRPCNPVTIPPSWAAIRS